jgi:hypothetical protein
MNNFLLSLTILAACTSSDDGIETKTLVNKDQHYRLERPQDWEPSSVRGMAQLVTTKLPRHTIVIRVADRPVSLGESRPGTDASIVDMTERVLMDLPKAKLADKSAVTGSELPGVVFDLTFAPHSAHGRYHRAHALLLGQEHLYHVIYSAPANEPIQWDAYNAVVRSLNEGV